MQRFAQTLERHQASGGNGMDAQALRRLLPELNQFVARFADCFVDRRSREHLPVDVQGQLSDLDRKSVEPIALKAGLPPRSLQEFLSLLSWDELRMRDRVQQIVAADHAGPNTVGLIDETSVVKKGTKTPGVQRQWCGHVGKVENCMVTVHLGYVQGDFQCLLDGDLYLPESWHEDRARCRAAGIPDDVVYRPKWKIALEQYDRAVANGIHFDWLTFDEHYGSKPEFLTGLSSRHQTWVAEVPKDTCGWLAEPRVTTQPRRNGSRGRRPTKPRLVKASPTAKRADRLWKHHPKLRDQTWTRYRFDDREQGPSVWEAKHAAFWPTAVQGVHGEQWHLIVARHVLREGELKFFLSNAPTDTPTETLLWVALSRHRVERCFQDQKSELGLDHYEGRTYRGLIRHLLLTCVSFLFLMRATLKRRGEKPRVDRAASSSSRGQPDHHSVVQPTNSSIPPGPTGRRDPLSSTAQHPGPQEPRQTHQTTVTTQRRPVERNDSLQTARLAL
jgi:SRSO17 transposase